MDARPQFELVAPGASPEEAAAVVAALEQFMREHAVVVVEESDPAHPAVSPWRAAALRDGVNRAPDSPPFWA